ncbi:MAG: hypothetical protein LBK98_04470 [Peptococcaceae bacterium]|jgi:hypothetical protein|nr:hypothetical protein [Peptococcaceae bacterium]
MATKTQYAHISVEETYAIEKAMFDRGYLTHEYVVPAKTVETDIPCPICGKKLSLYVSGNSYQIDCKAESTVITTCRGL